MNRGRDLSLFCSKTLPVLINLNICEALEKVVGKDYQNELLTFERNKTREIDNYISSHSTINSFK